MLQKASDSEDAAKRSTSEDEVYVVPAFVGLGAPYWDQAARGAMFGLTRGTTKEDIIKATLQSIAYQVRDIIDTMQDDTGIKIPVLKVDGGAANNEYLMQFQTDILNVPIQRAENLETTALGAAFLAGLAVGYWKDTDEIREFYEAGKLFEVQMEEECRCGSPVSSIRNQNRIDRNAGFCRRDFLSLDQTCSWRYSLSEDI